MIEPRERLEELYGSAVPPWMRSFVEHDVEALDALLRGRVSFGHLNVAEPEELLIDWANVLPEESWLARALDSALARWIEARWGQVPELAGLPLPLVWQRVLTIVANLEWCTEAGAGLRQHWDDAVPFVGPLSGSPSRDPLGRYYMAVAQHQHDRSLLQEWWRLCNLTGGVAYYHGAYGITGLRRLPPPEGQHAGGFRDDVAMGVVRLARALARRVAESDFPEPVGRRVFQTTTRLTIAAYPFSERWQPYWAQHHGREDDLVREWLKPFVQPARSRRGRTPVTLPSADPG